jgi:DNA modification methylase
VLDPFCGSGTTLLAAAQMGRRWAGIDANPEALALARQRLAHDAAERAV